MENISKYSDLYKSHCLINEQPQEKRRQSLLFEQKKQRAKLQDTIRDIQEIVKSFRNNTSENHHRHKTYKQKYDHDHKLQLSEWLREKPKDLDRWFLVPCPKGIRCLVIATDGFTEMYSKNGRFIRSFHSMLPGDGTLRQQVSILDCIFIENLQKFFVLDAIAFGNQELINCETEFRFFWITSKLNESDLCENSNKNKYAFVPIQFYDFDDEYALSSCLARFPQWEDNGPDLDGFLFYHKESSYVFGTTPLVGWLFSFMIPEVLQLPVNDNYLKDKPIDYVTAIQYIKTFDENLLKKKHSRHKRRSNKMEQDVREDDNEKELEMEDGRLYG